MSITSLRQKIYGRFYLLVLSAIVVLPGQVGAQQKELPEINILTAVSNMAFSAVWVAEQLKYFEQEGIRVKVTSAGGGAPCQTAVVGRSAHMCAEHSSLFLSTNHSKRRRLHLETADTLPLSHNAPHTALCLSEYLENSLKLSVRTLQQEKFYRSRVHL